MVKVGGVLRKVVFFVMALPYSDAMFVQAFERICMETLWEAHVRAFAFFGGVPWRITYDNERVAVAKVLGAHERKLTRGFLELMSHYLFDAHFCRVRRANEKGVVEGTVKYARQHFLVPVPQVRDLAELNAQLLACCAEDLGRRLRGKPGTKRELLAEDREAFLALPAAPLDACRKVSTFANSLSLVRFDRNDYSVPTEHAHQRVCAVGSISEVKLIVGTELVARHRRCATLGRNRMAAHGIHLRNHGHGDVGVGLDCRDRGAQAGRTAADDNHVVLVDIEHRPETPSQSSF